MSIIK